jgi:DnaJ-class molecular chaperone
MKITKAQAAAELGVEVDASEDDIRSAYKVFTAGQSQLMKAI